MLAENNNNANIIVRHRLMDLLDSVSDKRIIYVCASAGFGKTVCIHQWIERSKLRNAFISLDDYDNRMMSFCKKFCEALLIINPKNDKLREILSHPAFESASDEFALRAIDVLSSRKRAILVIDDLQYILDERLQRLIFVFIQRLPSKYQIVLISRIPLPVGLYDFMARDYMVSITEDRFQFSEEEISLLYKKGGRYITAKQAQRIFRFTGGWAIAVNALILAGNKMLDRKNICHLEDYIRMRVWEQWDEDTRDFMLKTATLRYLYPALCDAVTGRSDSKKLLKQLVSQNAFVMQIKKGVFQYHHLFHAFLRHTLETMDADFTRPLLEEAGKWHLAQRDFYGAMDYFVECESYDGIAESFGLLVSDGREYFFIEKLAPLANLPIIQKAAERFPYIYSILAWAAFNEGRAADMAKYADLYYQKQSEIVKLDPRLILNIVLVSLIDFRSSLSELIASVMQMPTNPSVSTLSDVGVSLGIINQNMPMLHRGTRDFSECAIVDVEASVLKAHAVFGGLFGKQSVVLAESLAAGLLYEQGHLESASSHALNAYSAVEKDFSSETKFCAVMALVIIQDALGESYEADNTLKQMEKIIEEDKAYNLNYNFAAFIARRKLAKGNKDAAHEWLREHEVSMQSNLDFYKLYIHFTTCRAYIVSGSYPEAIALLTKVLNLSETYKRPLDIIEARILLSIAFNKAKRGSQSKAISYLEQAVALAHQFGYTQMFINESAELAPMLKWLQNRATQNNEPPAFLSFIRMLHLGAQIHMDAAVSAETAQTASDYTTKQKEVMKLLCDGKSRQEIADVMRVKISTVRSHIDSIYKKLNVSSATDAVIKIKASGILAE